MPSMLEHADKDTWCDALPDSEGANRFFAAWTTGDKLCPFMPGHKSIRRPCIRLCFNICRVTPNFLTIDKHILFAMEQDMCCFMKEGEPQVIIRFMANA